MSQEKPLAIVAGAGSGLGQALMRQFATEGCRAVGYSRSPQDEAFDEDGNPLDVRVLDLADAAVAGAALNEVIAEFGPPKVVVHNTAHLIIRPFAEISPSEFEETWKAMVQSAVVLGQASLPAMAAAGGGTFIVSGATASLRGGAKFSAFASAKFALRGLTQAMAREYHDAGVHVVHTILDGIIDTPRSRELHPLDPARMLKPEDIAENYWFLTRQPQSAWSNELDLRPMVENF